MNSLYIDEKYIALLSSKLQQFQKTGKVWVFRCPICLDSKKNKRKRRGYVYKMPNIPTLCYKCHNCGVSWTLGKLIEHMDAELYASYKLERYRDGHSGRSAHKTPEFKIAFDRPHFQTPYPDLNLKSMVDLPLDNTFKQYIINRRIPEKFYNQIFHVPDFKEWAKGRVPEEKYETLIEKDARILFPFYSPNRTLIGGQGRTIQKTMLRYLTFKIKEDDELVFGMDRLDTNETIYVVEGPIDSLFVSNCIAAASSDLAGCTERIKRYLEISKDKYVLIFDNEPRNKQIVQLMEKSSKKFKIVIWPEHIKEKDINDMILAGKSQEQLISIIKENTFEGLNASLQLSAWKKC